MKDLQEHETPVELEAEVVTAMSLNSQEWDLIERSKHLDELEAAYDKFRRFALRRALAGDWVKFGEGDKQKLELTGAGSERIAVVLGVSFSDFDSWKEEGEDEKGKYYYWWYKCKATMGKRSIVVEGRAGTRDKFFGYAYGNWKDLPDINEGNIRTAARRNCMKEGVKIHMGLRHITPAEGKALGLDLSKVPGWEFKTETKDKKTNGSSSSTKKETKKKAPEGETGKAKIRIEKFWTEARGKWTLNLAEGSDGVTYQTFDKDDAKKLRALEGSMAEISWEKNPKYGMTIQKGGVKAV